MNLRLRFLYDRFLIGMPFPSQKPIAVFRMSLRQQQGKDVPAPGDNQVMLRYILLLDASCELKIVLC